MLQKRLGKTRVKCITLPTSVDFQDMMNREKHYLLPKMQVGFIDAICHPIYKVSEGKFHKVQKLGHWLGMLHPFMSTCDMTKGMSHM